MLLYKKVPQEVTEMLEILHVITIGTIMFGVGDIQNGDWIGILPIFLGCMMILLFIMFGIAIALWIYQMIDTSGPTQTMQGVVKGKRYVPAHITQVYNAATKTTVPIYHPSRWYTTFIVQEVAEEIQVDKEIFDAVGKDDQMNVRTTTGRLSKRTRILELAPQ